MFRPRVTWKRALFCMPLIPLAAVLYGGKAEPVPMVNVIRIDRGDISRSFTAYGRTVLPAPVTLAAPATGMVDGLSLRPGDGVDKGQLLLHLRSTSLERSRAAMRARLDVARREIVALERQVREEPLNITVERAKAARDLAAAQEDLLRSSEPEKEGEIIEVRRRLDLSRIEELETKRQLELKSRLLAKGIVSHEDLTALKAELKLKEIDNRHAEEELNGLSTELGPRRADHARRTLSEVSARLAQLDARTTNLALLSEELACARRQLVALDQEADALEAQSNACTLRSPVNGIILESTVNEGDWAQEGQCLLKVVDPAKLAAEVLVDEMDLPLVTRGAMAVLSSDALTGTTFPARVLRIRPIVDGGTRKQSSRIPIEVSILGNGHSNLTASSMDETSTSADPAGHDSLVRNKRRVRSDESFDRLHADMSVQATFDRTLAQGVLRLPTTCICENPEAHVDASPERRAAEATATATAKSSVKSTAKSSVKSTAKSSVKASTTNEKATASRRARDLRSSIQRGVVQVLRVSRSRPHRVELVDVHIGVRNEEAFEVLDGLEAGDLVLSAPGPSIKIGRIVRIEGDDAESPSKSEEDEANSTLAGSCTDRVTDGRTS